MYTYTDKKQHFSGTECCTQHHNGFHWNSRAESKHKKELTNTRLITCKLQCTQVRNLLTNK